MRKLLAYVLTLVCVLSLVGCSEKSEDNSVVYNINADTCYWDELEVKKAMDTAETYFIANQNFRRCELNEIRYSNKEDERSRTHDEMIVLSIDFSTKLFTAVYGLNPVSDYTYTCVLIKNGDIWEVLSFGQP